MDKKLWGGRFKEGTDVDVEAFTSSIDIDKKLYYHDIEGSIAHCKMLAKALIITDKEADLIVKGLKEIKQEIEENRLEFKDSLEDIHMHIEDRLTQKIGDSAKKLHTARSRNDQVAVSMRMYIRDKTEAIILALKNMQNKIIELAQKNIDVILPGYTHLQRAQPVLFSHHLMAYFEMFKRDAQRFKDCLARININPLGAAALAGTTYDIDRHLTTDLLFFEKPAENSIDAVSDRDFVIEFVSCAAICMTHLSRMSEEFILWSSSEFNFIEISDAFTTGSSIMPQKKNPDVCELVRGKTGRVFGDLTAILTIMKSLPLAYNRDMQEDKEPMFDAATTLINCINIYTKMLPDIKINKDKMINAASKGFLNATDFADYLVKKGMPFREAHSRAGKAVAMALQKNKEIHDLTLDELKGISELVEQDVFDCLTVESMVKARKSYGGTSPDNVTKNILKAKKELQDS